MWRQTRMFLPFSVLFTRFCPLSLLYCTTFWASPFKTGLGLFNVLHTSEDSAFLMFSSSNCSLFIFHLFYLEIFVSLLYLAASFWVWSFTYLSWTMCPFIFIYERRSPMVCSSCYLCKVFFIVSFIHEEYGIGFHKNNILEYFPLHSM